MKTRLLNIGVIHIIMSLWVVLSPGNMPFEEVQKIVICFENREKFDEE